MDLIEYSSAQDITVSSIDGHRSVATASLSPTTEPGVWWVARVFVRPEYRKKGLGRAVVDKIKAAAQQRGVHKLVVCPGGYDIPQEVQEAFYVSCGFEKVCEGTYEALLSP